MPDDIRAQLDAATGDSAAPRGDDTKVAVADAVDGKAGADTGSDQKGTVSLEAFQEVLDRLKSRDAEFEAIKGPLAFVQKVKQVLSDDAAGTALSPRDEMVLKELNRLVPGLRYLDQIPKAIEAVQAVGKEAISNVQDAAWRETQRLTKDAGFQDPEQAKLLGGNIRDWIMENPERQSRFRSGDKDLIKEGFEHVVAKLYGPDRLKAKRSVVRAGQNAPRIPESRGGGAGEPSGGTKIDFKGPTARADVRNALKAYATGMGREES